MRRQFFAHGEFLCFLAAWAVGLLGAWADFRADDRADVAHSAAVAFEFYDAPSYE